jgi:Glycosyltransferases involved in cell wall biogenesis
MFGNISIIVPYYRNPYMLKEQISVWDSYLAARKGFTFIVVDDGSPEKAEDIVRKHASYELMKRLRLYRIGVDIPWNRGGARNLGAHVADTKYIMHIDIDHVLPASCAQNLLEFSPAEGNWYRFERYRNGRADATRKKDQIPTDMPFGKIHPHVDSFICTKDLFWMVGGYDEDYSGCLGGGNPFLAHLTKAAPVDIMPPGIHLHVYTRDAVPDASDITLSRDSSEYSRRKKEKERAGRTKPVNPLRFPWERVL